MPNKRQSKQDQHTTTPRYVSGSFSFWISLFFIMQATPAQAAVFARLRSIQTDQPGHDSNEEIAKDISFLHKLCGKNIKYNEDGDIYTNCQVSPDFKEQPRPVRRQ